MVVETLDFCYGAIVALQELAMAAMEIYNTFIEKGGGPPVVHYVDEELANKVEVRHTFVDKPRIGILGVSSIHATIFNDAGLVEGIHYHALGTNVELNINPKCCFNLVSNSHDTLKNSPGWYGRLEYEHLQMPVEASLPRALLLLHMARMVLHKAYAFFSTQQMPAKVMETA